MSGRLCGECGRRATFVVEPAGRYDFSGWGDLPACDEHVGDVVRSYVEELPRLQVRLITTPQLPAGEHHPRYLRVGEHHDTAPNTASSHSWQQPNPSPTSVSAPPLSRWTDWCVERGHPGTTYHPWFGLTWCACGAVVVVGNTATHDLCCGMTTAVIAAPVQLSLLDGAA